MQLYSKRRVIYRNLFRFQLDHEIHVYCSASRSNQNKTIISNESSLSMQKYSELNNHIKHLQVKGVYFYDIVQE